MHQVEYGWMEILPNGMLMAGWSGPIIEETKMSVNQADATVVPVSPVQAEIDKVFKETDRLGCTVEELRARLVLVLKKQIPETAEGEGDGEDSSNLSPLALRLVSIGKQVSTSVSSLRKIMERLDI